MADIQISLTQFLDFTLKRSGRSRTNYVRSIKYSDYNPATDYWKQLRDEIKEVHSSGHPLNDLDQLIDQVNERKRHNYSEAIKLYKKFFRNKDIQWFDPGNSHRSFNGELVVNSNPELGLFIDGTPHLIKLYFKGGKARIDKHSVTSTLSLMNTATFNKELPDETIASVLNIKRTKIHSDNFVDDDLLISLEGDAQQLIYLWKNV